MKYTMYIITLLTMCAVVSTTGQYLHNFARIPTPDNAFIRDILQMPVATPADTGSSLTKVGEPTVMCGSRLISTVPVRVRHEARGIDVTTCLRDHRKADILREYGHKLLISLYITCRIMNGPSRRSIHYQKLRRMHLSCHLKMHIYFQRCRFESVNHNSTFKYASCTECKMNWEMCGSELRALDTETAKSPTMNHALGMAESPRTRQPYVTSERLPMKYQHRASSARLYTSLPPRGVLLQSYLCVIISLQGCFRHHVNTQIQVCESRRPTMTDGGAMMSGDYMHIPSGKQQRHLCRDEHPIAIMVGRGTTIGADHVDLPSRPMKCHRTQHLDNRQEYETPRVLRGACEYKYLYISFMLQEHPRVRPTNTSVPVGAWNHKTISDGGCVDTNESNSSMKHRMTQEHVEIDISRLCSPGKSLYSIGCNIGYDILYDDTMKIFICDRISISDVIYIYFCTMQFICWSEMLLILTFKTMLPTLIDRIIIVVRHSPVCVSINIRRENLMIPWDLMKCIYVYKYVVVSEVSSNTDRISDNPVHRKPYPYHDSFLYNTVRQYTTKICNIPICVYLYYISYEQWIKSKGNLSHDVPTASLPQPTRTEQGRHRKDSVTLPENDEENPIQAAVLTEYVKGLIVKQRCDFYMPVQPTACMLRTELQGKPSICEQMHGRHSPVILCPSAILCAACKSEVSGLRDQKGTLKVKNFYIKTTCQRTKMI